MAAPDQEFFEAVAEKIPLPIAIAGAAGLTITVVGLILAMLLLGTPGPAGTEQGPDVYYRTAR